MVDFHPFEKAGNFCDFWLLSHFCKSFLPSGDPTNMNQNRNQNSLLVTHQLTYIHQVNEK